MTKRGTKQKQSDYWFDWVTICARTPLLTLERLHRPLASCLSICRGSVPEPRIRTDMSLDSCKRDFSIKQVCANHLPVLCYLREGCL